MLTVLGIIAIAAAALYGVTVWRHANYTKKWIRVERTRGNIIVRIDSVEPERFSDWFVGNVITHAVTFSKDYQLKLVGRTKRGLLLNRIHVSRGLDVPNRTVEAVAITTHPMNMKLVMGALEGFRTSGKYPGIFAGFDE